MKVKVFGFVLLLSLLNVGVKAAALPDYGIGFEVGENGISPNGYQFQGFKPTIDGQSVIVKDTTHFMVSGDGSTAVMIQDGECSHFLMTILRLNGGKEPIPLPGCFPVIISDDGQVVTGWQESKSECKAFRWTEDTGVKLLPIEGEQTRGRGMNKDGSAIYASVGIDDKSWVQWDGGEEITPVEGGFEALEKLEHVVVARWCELSADGFIKVDNGYGLGVPRRLLLKEKFEGWPKPLRTELIIDILNEQGLAAGWKLTEVHYISPDGEWVTGIGYPPEEIGWLLYGELYGWVAKIPRSHGDKPHDARLF